MFLGRKVRLRREVHCGNYKLLAIAVSLRYGFCLQKEWYPGAECDSGKQKSVDDN